MENKTPYKWYQSLVAVPFFTKTFFLIKTKGLNQEEGWECCCKHHSRCRSGIICRWEAPFWSCFGQWEQRWGAATCCWGSSKCCSGAVLAPLLEEDWDAVLASFSGRERHLGNEKALWRRPSVVLPSFRCRFGTTDDAANGRRSPTLSMLFLAPLMVLQAVQFGRHYGVVPTPETPFQVFKNDAV